MSSSTARAHILATLAFFFLWSLLYGSYVGINRIAKHDYDRAHRQVLLLKDPGDTDPYVASGVILTLIGTVLAGPLLILAYAACSILASGTHVARRLSPLYRSLLTCMVLGISVFYAWQSNTHDYTFAAGAAGIVIVSALIGDGIYWWLYRLSPETHL